MTSEAVITGLLGSKARVTCAVNAYMATYTRTDTPVVVSVPKALMAEFGSVVDDPKNTGPHVRLGDTPIATIDPETLTALVAFAKANVRMLKSKSKQYPVGLFVGGGLSVFASDAQVAALSHTVIEAEPRFVIPSSVSLTLRAFAHDGDVTMYRTENRLIMCSNRIRVSMPWREVEPLGFTTDAPGVTFARADLKRFVKACGEQQSWLISEDGEVSCGAETLSGVADEGFVSCDFLCDATDINRVLAASKTPEIRVNKPDDRAIIFRDETGAWAVAPRRYLSVT